MFVCVKSKYLLVHDAYTVLPPDVYGGGHIEVAGGTFKEGRSSVNAGFLFARAGSVVNITGGNIVNNQAVYRGGGVSPTLLYKPLSSNVCSVQAHCSVSPE